MEEMVINKTSGIDNGQWHWNPDLIVGLEFDSDGYMNFLQFILVTREDHEKALA